MAIRDTIESSCPAILRPLWERLKRSPLGMRLARGIFWSVLAHGAGRVTALTLTLLLSRVLGKEGFGQYGMVQMTLDVVSVAGGLGLGATAQKFVAENREKDKDKAGRVLALTGVVSWAAGSLVALVLFAFADLLAHHALHAPEMALLLRLSAGVLLFRVVNDAQIQALSGFEAFQAMARASLLANLVALALGPALAWFYGVHGLLVALIACAALEWGLYHWTLRRECARHRVPFQLRGWQAERRLVWSFSLPIVLSPFLYQGARWCASALVARTGNGFGELGIFTAASQWYTVVAFLPVLTGYASVPILASLLGAGEKRRFRKFVAANAALHVGSAAVVALVLALLAPHVMALYGPSFADQGDVLRLVMVYSVLAIAAGFLIGVATSMGKVWIRVSSAIVWSTVWVGTVYLWPEPGAKALACGTLFAYMFSLPLLMATVIRAIPAREAVPDGAAAPVKPV